MKKSNLFFIALVFVFFISSCATFRKSEGFLSKIPIKTADTTKTFEESYLIWQKLKDENNNSYVYQTGVFSINGSGSTTEITVVNGIVTERKYQRYEYNQKKDKGKIVKQYVENSSNIGTNAEGAEPCTIDDLYKKCQTQYMGFDTEGDELFFETTSEGMMKTCGYFIADGFDGVDIIGFKWLDK